VTYTAWFNEMRKDDIALVGGKGANLGELSHAGLPVPPGFVVTTRAYDAFVEAGDLKDEIVGLASQAEDPAAFEAAEERIRALFARGEIPDDVAAEVRTAYDRLANENGQAVAVRSSATAEDLPGASFAGQQDTYLNVVGAGTLMEAVRACWASLWTARAMSYRDHESIDPAKVSLAVVVQRMVPAEAAGTLFTADPVSGRRDRAVINAAWGLGEAVVGGQVTPDTLVVEKSSGRMISRETADKEVMTVYTEDGTGERPVPQAQRRAPVLDDGAAAELARYGARIEDHYGAPQDIEWALAGGEFVIVQARPITTLSEAQPPTDWTVPDPKGYYVRGSIVELLPDPLSPLFATLSAEPVAQTIQRMVEELLGEGFFTERGIEFTTINGYAYYYMALTPGMTLRMVRAIPTAGRSVIVGQAGEKLWREEFRPRYARAVEEWETKPLREMSAAGLFAGVKELLYRGTEYYTSVQLIMPSAYVSDPLFTAFYDRLIKREGDPPAQTFLLGFDSTPIRAEKSLYDLATWCREHPELAAALLDTPSDGAPGLLRMDHPGVDEAVWREWRSRFRDHLDRYGRMIYDLDFAKPVAADDPAPLFDTLKYYLRGEGKNPHERQRTAAGQREHYTRVMLFRLKGVRRTIFRRLLGWAQRYAPLREDALADVGLAWPLMRQMLFELGRRLAAAGAIERVDDVFWLEQDELRDAAAALDAGRTEIERYSDAVGERRTRWRAQRLVTPPTLLPKGRRLMGVDWERWMPARSDEQTGDTIEGAGASSGRVTARARVLRGPEDFGEMLPGEVLVAGITTPAWTPLFAMASAVVTDVGGPLSHGSIVAREYGIPAVMGTGVATRLIQSGQSVRVDGDAGTVALLDGSDEADAERPSPEPGLRSRPNANTVALFALAAGAVLAAWWRYRRRS
jgi:phosphohistidine swiveling domain-containing protein